MTRKNAGNSSSFEFCHWSHYITVTPHVRHGVSDHRRFDCLFNSLFRLTTKEPSNLRIAVSFERNPLVTCGFPAQRASNAENISMTPSWICDVNMYIFILKQFETGLFCTAKVLISNVLMLFVCFISGDWVNNANNLYSRICMGVFNCAQAAHDYISCCVV